MTTVVGPFSLERVVNAVENVRRRLLKAAATLEAAGIPYAIVGDDAVALWVSRVDEAAVRNTRDVDVLIRREDLSLVRTALESAGFAYRHVAGVDVFLDTAAAKPRDAVRIVFANEKVRPDEPVANPDVGEAENAGAFRVIALEALVRIKLTAFRDKDRTHLRDLIDVGLLDAGWLGKLHPLLAERLRQVLDSPLG
jgi:hypothetical protein